MPSESMSKGWRRDVNTERLGYFRTDDATTTAIARIVRPPMSETEAPNIQLMDPCCGEGLASQQLAHAWGDVTSWGIEYDESRFTEASERMDYVLNTDAIGESFISSAWASAMLFNPPYGDEDRDKNDSDSKRQRLEAIFWKAHAARVVRGGLMIAILPVGLFARAPGMSRAMSNYFAGEKVSVYRVTDQKFHQVVIIGYRRRNREAPPNEKLRQTLIDLSEDRGDVPTIDTAPDNEFVITEQGKAPSHFEALYLTQAMAEVEVRSEPQSVISDIERDMNAHQSRGDRRRTLMPLRQGHIPLLLAAGGLDGVVEDDDMKLLVKGSVARVAHNNQSVDTFESQSGETKKTTTENTYKWQTRILAWDLTPGAEHRLLTIQ